MLKEIKVNLLKPDFSLSELQSKALNFPIALQVCQGHKRQEKYFFQCWLTIIKMNKSNRQAISLSNFT